MRRSRPWLSILTSLSAGLALSVIGGPATGTPAAVGLASADQPNILIVNLDDLRAAGTLPVMPRVRDYFQQGGRTYSQSYATTPLCSPSRGSLFTGRYPHNHGVTGNGLDAEIAALNQSATFQGYLQSAGYHTAMAGKYMNTVPLTRSPQRWDRWLMMTGGYSDLSYNENGTVRKIPGYYSDVLGDHVVSDLNEFEQQDDQPWLIYIAPEAPHSPITPSAPYVNASVPAWTYPASFNEADIADKPANVRGRGLLDPATVEKTRKDQLRTIMSVDDLVGRVVDEMSRLGEDSRTLAIFTSDNGFFWGEHRLAEKRLPYTDAGAVPLMVRWPGHLTAGSVDDRLVSNVDILPTLLDASGVAPQLTYPLDGASIFSATTRSEMLLEYGRSLDAPLPPWASVLTRNNQFTQWYAADTGALAEREFYDLSSDPLQLVNLLRDGTTANDPDIADWSERLAALRSCAGSACFVTGDQQNEPPVARIAAPTCNGFTCQLSGAQSSDSDGSVVGYRWEFGDGASATGVAASHTYLTPGTFTVRLTVTDDVGATGTATQAVTVSSGSLAYRAGTSARVNAVRLSVRVPTTARPDDLLLLMVSANRSAVTLSAPAGWTRLGRVADSTLQSVAWWRRATASDPGSTLSVTSTASAKLDAQVLAYSGAATTPIVAYATSIEAGTTATHRTPTITVPSAGAWLLSYWADKEGTGTGWTCPGSVVRRLQSVGSGSGRVTSISADSGAPVSTGTAGGIAATSSASSNMATMWSIVIASGGSPAP